ncbi:hypothetical protein IM543_21240 [Massilia sp. UMI-21]|nr:hypothetical protein IM543_21240 [Massilia sp. UMI-21]
MSVDNPRVVDFIAVDHEANAIVLTIADHLPWEADAGHFAALQEKLNVYLAFIESGELLAAYPEAAGRKVRIALMHRAPLTVGALRLLESARAIITEAGFDLTWQHLPG